MTRREDASGRVLLVDDDYGILRDYGRLLRRLNLIVETATSGRDALDRLEGYPFDVVLADIGLSGCDGLELLRAIRERDRSLPVVLMTGAPSFPSAVKAVEYGASQYLVKPVQSEELGEAVWRAIDVRRSQVMRIAALTPGEQALVESKSVLGRYLDEALDSVWIAFQPIVEPASGSIVAYEALARSGTPGLETALDLFDTAEELQRTHELGRRIRERVATAAASAPPDVLLFVNVHGAELCDNELLSKRAPLSRFAQRVVLEISARTSLQGISGLSTRLTRLRELGFRIAVDDLGAGDAGLTSVFELAPDFVKLDRSLVSGLHRSMRKRSLVRSVARACSRDLGMEVIAEGVEQPADGAALLEDGVRLLQGFLFAKPGRGFPGPTW